MVTRPTTTIQDIHDNVKTCEELIYQVKDMIDREPITERPII